MRQHATRPEAETDEEMEVEMNTVCSIGRMGLAVLAAVTLAACGPTTGNKAGGLGQAVVLQMVTPYGEPGYLPQVDFLMDRVDKLSAGNVRIEMVYRAGGFEPDAEEQAVRAVAAGATDLGVVGTRAFDTMGVNAFQALTAPMLIDSYPLERAVVGSDIPAKMLRSLDQLHVVGLGLLADGLRKPAAVHKPLLGTQDWQGIIFDAVGSRQASSAIRALGGRPTGLLGANLDAAFDSGAVEGAERHLYYYRRNDMWMRAPYVSANVNLWPQMLAVLGSPDRLAMLTPEQRGWLAQGVADAANRSTDLVSGDAGLIADLCANGARFANASDADLAALRNAFNPVYAEVEQEPQTKQYIAEIKQLKQQTPAGDPLAIPDGCTGRAPNPPPHTPSTPTASTDVTALDGDWDVSYTRDDLVAAKPDPSEVVAENYGQFTLTLRRGNYIYTHKDPQTGWRLTGSYTVERQTITFHPAQQVTWTYKWSVYRDALTLEPLSGQAPDCSLSVSLGLCEPTTLVVKPWRRVST
jgi:TRAP-type transport system periplasmic protein